MIGLVALGLVVFLSLFFGGGATSPLNFICKDFDRTLYEGKFAIAEVPAYDLTSKDSREILSFFAFERKDPYALELLEKWRNSLKAYRECPTYTAFHGESYTGYCDGAKTAIYNLTFSGKPVVLAVDPLCLHSESFRSQTLQRFRDTFPENKMVDRALAEMMDKYGLEGDVEANAKILKEGLELVARIPPIISWMTYWSILDQQGKLFAELPLRERLSTFQLKGVILKSSNGSSRFAWLDLE